jgi:hypothetical protein
MNDTWFVPIIVALLTESSGARSLALWEGGVFSSEAWTQWRDSNANNLAWIALVVAGVLVSSLLV